MRDHEGPVYDPKSIEFVDGLLLTPVGTPDRTSPRTRDGADRERMVH